MILIKCIIKDDDSSKTKKICENTIIKEPFTIEYVPD